MALQKITAQDPIEMTGFVVTDLDGAARATGVVRCAKKVLMDGARTMARSQTYAWAVLGEQISGASAGISVDPSARSDGIAAFVDAVLPRVVAGELSLDAAKGVGPAELVSLTERDVRGALRNAERSGGTLADELLAVGAFASAAAATMGDLEGRTVAIEGAGGALPALLEAAATHGTRVVAVSTPTGTLMHTGGLDPSATSQAWREHGDALVTTLGSDAPPSAVFACDADIIMCGSKLGLVDDAVATSMAQRLIVPIGPAIVTAKGLAVAGRRGIIVLADFVSASGALFADHPPEGATAEDLLRAAAESIISTTTACAEHPEGPYLAACYRAEEFLTSWRDTLPFGRPLA